MSVFSPIFREHLAGDATTLCHCWRLTRRDGAAFRFTDHDRPLTVGGQTYQPESGLAQSEARASLGLGIDAVDVEGALSSDLLSEADIAAGLFDGAIVETLLVNWRTPSQFAHIRKAAIGKITLADGRFLAELESVAAGLDQPNGRYLRRACDARLGDARCRKNLSGSEWNGTGTVLGAAAWGSVRVSGIDGFAAGWFSHGEVTWTGGVLDGGICAVVDHRRTLEGTLLVLPAAEAMPAAGTTFAVVAGCDKSFATCKAKFSNPLNFRGFPHLPGNDAGYGYVAEGGEFDGEALVE